MSLNDSNRPVLPVCLCISTNSAMGNTVSGGANNSQTRIALVQSAIEYFLASCARDILPYHVAVSILIFDDVVTKIRDFEIITPQNVQIPILKHDRPYTAVGEVMNTAMDLIEDYRRQCANDGSSCLPPVLLLLYAGKRNHGTPQAMKRAAVRFARMTSAEGLQAALLGISNVASLDVLRQAAPGASVERIDPWSLRKMIPTLIKAMGSSAMKWAPLTTGTEPGQQQAARDADDTKRYPGRARQAEPDPAQSPFITSVWDV